MFWLTPNRVRGYKLGTGGALENAPYIDSSDKVPAGGLLTTDQQGATATLLLIPEKKFTVAILANTGNADIASLANSIADAVSRY